MSGKPKMLPGAGGGKPTPLDMLKRLKAQAASGNPRARAELRKLENALRTATLLRQTQGAEEELLGIDFAGGTLHGAGVEDVGDYGVYAQDELDRADAIASGMPGADQLDVKATVRQGKWAELQSVASFARVNPPSVLQGTIGGQQVVTAGGQALDVAHWVGTDDAETIPVTITLAPVEQITQATPILGGGAILPEFRPFGILQFGTRGFLTKAEVDIGTGCQFTVNASQVTLQVAMEPFDNGFKRSPGSMKLAGMLSFYTGQRESRITRTRYLTPNTSALGETVNVPPFSSDVIVFNGDATGAAFELDFVDGGGVTIYKFVKAAGTFMTTPVPIAGDIAQIIYISAITNVNVRLIFGLHF